MKEFESTPIMLNKGLRRFKSTRNSDELDGCHNLMPTEKGVELHEILIDLNSTGTTWNGLGKLSRPMGLADVTLNVTTFTSLYDVSGVTVYLDGILQGTTDSDGNITLSDISIGIHDLKLTKSGYTDSDSDDLYNEYIIVEPIKEVVISITDLWENENISGVDVYVNGKYMGQSDSGGDITCWLRPGVHKLKLVKSDFTFSGKDDIINDYITVT